MSLLNKPVFDSFQIESIGESPYQKAVPKAIDSPELFQMKPTNLLMFVHL